MVHEGIEEPLGRGIEMAAVTVAGGRFHLAGKREQLLVPQRGSSVHGWSFLPSLARSASSTVRSAPRRSLVALRLSDRGIGRSAVRWWAVSLWYWPSTVRFILSTSTPSTSAASSGAHSRPPHHLDHVPASP